MALTPEQYAKLMSGVKLATRAKIVGLEAPKTKADRSLLAHIDSQNMNRQQSAAETRAAETKRVLNKGRILLSGAPQALEDSGMTAEGFEFDESQVNAIQTLLSPKHVALIGAAGTGKTTMVKHALAQMIYGSEGQYDDFEPIGIRQLDGDQGPSIAICAFTGIATQVIRETLPSWIHPACKTIHTLLEYKPAQMGEDDTGKRAMFVPTRGVHNKLDHDVIVIDEASMLGLDLWHNLVDALRPHTKVILIGDLNQLKPVADATMFAYALSAGLDGKYGWALAELTTIHRQKEAAANKIIDGAHAILSGKTPVFDDPAKDPNWRFIGYELSPKADVSHKSIVEAINWMRSQPTPGNPERALFDPYQDLLLTAGNGLDENDSASFVQQAPLNGTLSRLIEPPSEEHPVYIVDAGRESKKFAVGHRVMATKNESPDMKDRVTNGLTGRIISIESNPQWNGKKGMYGTEKEVMAFRTERAKALLGQGHESTNGVALGAFSLAEFDTSQFDAKNQSDEKQASHIIQVKFKNGATRTYRTAADVESIKLAYAVTVHKAQGSQADTVVIVCHHAVARQLSREWLYTAVTRAKRRVILLYTRMGLSKAIAKQQIYGNNLREKVNRYRQVMEAGNVNVRLRAYAVTFERDSTGTED